MTGHDYPIDKERDLWVSRSLDGDLGVAEQVAFNHHVAACTECRQALADAHAAQSLLRDLGRPAMPRELRLWGQSQIRLSPSSTLQRARPVQTLRLSWLFPASMLATAGAALLAVSAAIYVAERQGTDIGTRTATVQRDAAPVFAPAPLELEKNEADVQAESPAGAAGSIIAGSESSAGAAEKTALEPRREQRGREAPGEKSGEESKDLLESERETSSKLSAAENLPSSGPEFAPAPARRNAPVEQSDATRADTTRTKATQAEPFAPPPQTAPQSQSVDTLETSGERASGTLAATARSLSWPRIEILPSAPAATEPRKSKKDEAGAVTSAPAARAERTAEDGDRTVAESQSGAAAALESSPSLELAPLERARLEGKALSAELTLDANGGVREIRFGASLDAAAQAERTEARLRTWISAWRFKAASPKAPLPGNVAIRIQF